MKKFFVLIVLFALPIIAYLFFASGHNNFAKLPVLTQKVKDISHLEHPGNENLSFQDKISIVAFFGKNLEDIKGHTFNLDQKILEKYYEFDDFQFVIVLPESAREDVAQFALEFQGVGSPDEWKFVFGNESEVQKVFNSFQAEAIELNKNLFTPNVFIIDKELNLRGRDDDKDHGILYGYDSGSIADLSNKMNDDVKVVLAEYRLALKKNNAERSK